MLVMGATVLTSHILTTPYESQDAIVSPCKQYYILLHTASNLSDLFSVRLPVHICLRTKVSLLLIKTTYPQVECGVVHRMQVPIERLCTKSLKQHKHPCHAVLNLHSIIFQQMSPIRFNIQSDLFLTVLASHREMVLSAEQVSNVFENGRNWILLTESAWPRRVYRHLALYYNIEVIHAIIMLQHSFLP